MTRRGSTLLELVVTLAVMGIIAGVVTLALAPHRSVTGVPGVPGEARRLDDARRDAVTSRRAVTMLLTAGDRVVLVTALPDGEVLADELLSRSRLTGRASHALP